MSLNKRVLYFVVVILLGFFSFYYILEPKLNYKAPKLQVATLVKNLEPVTGFELTTFDGKSFNKDSLRGRWSLLFFGYMKCPDICPRTLGIVKQAWELEPMLNAKFIFVNLTNISNQREFAQFLNNYNKDFIGVSGSQQQVGILSSKLKIYRHELNNRIDHSPSLMLIDPKGKLRAVFNPPFTAEDIVTDLKAII